MVRKPEISICASTDEQSRKARKRPTDRKAQQEHRLRQKEYVRNLEKTVEELKAEHLKSMDTSPKESRCGVKLDGCISR
jgi:hypothetical protein